MAPLYVTVASNDFACYQNFIGYSLIKELRLIYSSQTLQRIHKDELFIWHQHFLTDEERAGYNAIVGGIAVQVWGCKSRIFRLMFSGRPYCCGFPAPADQGPGTDENDVA